MAIYNGAMSNGFQTSIAATIVDSTTILLASRMLGFVMAHRALQSTGLCQELIGFPVGQTVMVMVMVMGSVQEIWFVPSAA